MQLFIKVEKPNWNYTKNVLETVEVKDINEARALWCDIRDENCWGGSDYWFKTSGEILLGKKVIARVSYNGRVWDVKNDTSIKAENFKSFLASK